MSQEIKEALLDTTPLPQEVLNMVLEYSTIKTYDELRRVVKNKISGNYDFRPSLEEYERCMREGKKFKRLLSKQGFAFHVTFPKGWRKIKGWAFYRCNNLTSVTFPEGLQQVHVSAFEMCNNLTSVTLPEGLKQVGKAAFCRCSNLTSVTFPEGLRKIKKFAFYMCWSLTSVTLPVGLQQVEAFAFCGCSRVTSVTFPEGLKQVGYKAFYGCSSLTSVTLPQGCSYVDQSSGRPSFPPGCAIYVKVSETKRRRLELKPAFQQLRF